MEKNLHEWVKKHRLRNHPFVKDSDKDGVPNQVDCRPHDPKKQGVISVTYGGKPVKPFAAIREKISKWNEERPEREEKRIAGLKREATMEEQRLRIERARERVRGMKEKSYKRYSPMMGLGGSGFMSQPPANAPAIKPTTRRRRKPKRKRR